VSLYESIAPAIEAEVIQQIHQRIDNSARFDGQAQGNWIVQLVHNYFYEQDKKTLVTMGYVSCLMWEQIEAGALLIDKYGMVSRASAAD
jgi:hypothetical protein